MVLSRVKPANDSVPPGPLVKETKICFVVRPGLEMLMRPSWGPSPRADRLTWTYMVLWSVGLVLVPDGGVIGAIHGSGEETSKAKVVPDVPAFQMSKVSWLVSVRNIKAIVETPTLAA